MNKYILSIAACILFNLSNFQAQTIPQEYFDLVKKADSLYTIKDYKNSAFNYSMAFKAHGWKAMSKNRYDAACSWSMANYPDSAFFNLERIANLMGYSNYDHIIIDNDLVPLHADKRWNSLIEKVKQNKEQKEAKMNKPLVAKLDSIHNDDQAIRSKVGDVEKELGRDSKEVKAMWKEMHIKDSINLIKVVEILDKYGWLGADVVGGIGNMTLFLVIQHSDLQTQLKYLPMMREAVKNKNASPSDIALLEDRVLMRQGKKQIYGSQISRNKNGEFYVAALADPDNVDKLRAEMNLQPLAEYVKRWDIVWDVEQHKKQMPELEKELEKSKY
jgi:hypothetical protein